MAKIAKSAKDGKIVSKKFAEANPDTTFVQEAPKKKVKVDAPTHKMRDYYDEFLENQAQMSSVALGQFAWATKDDERMLVTIESKEPFAATQHLVESGVKCEREVESLDGFTLTPATDSEAFIYLA